MTRDGRLSSSRLKSSRSIAEALREKTLKLTPPGTTLAPSGTLRPVAVSTKVAEAADMDSPSAREFLCNRGHARRLEPEFPLEFPERRRRPQRRHSDHAPPPGYITPPSECGSPLHGDRGA